MIGWAVGDRGELRVSWGADYDYWCVASFLGWRDSEFEVAVAAEFFIGGDKKRAEDPFYCQEVLAEFEGEVWRGICTPEWVDEWGGGWTFRVWGNPAALMDPVLDRVLA